jgi:hypothetical protein
VSCTSTSTVTTPQWFTRPVLLHDVIARYNVSRCAVTVAHTTLEVRSS